MCHGRSKIFSVGAAWLPGDRRGTFLFVATRTTTSCTVRMYRSAQRKLISFTVPPCVSPAPNFTVRTGPQKRRSRPRTSLHRTRSLSRRHAVVPAFAAAVISRVQPLHVSAVPVRIFGSFGNSCVLARGKSVSRARGEAYWKQ